MSASYPSSVKVFTKKRDLLDIVLAADINQVYDEVTAIETILGTFPATNLGYDTGTFNTSTLSWPSIRARIQNIEYGVFEAFNDRVKSTGGTTITSAANGTVSLAIRAKSGQTANLFEARTSGNTLITAIDTNGVLKIGGSDAATVSTSQTLTNKIMSGLSNSFENIPTSAVIVAGSTDIQEYVEARPTVYYQASAPTGVVTGTIWVDSTDSVDPFDSSGLLLKDDPSPSVGTFGYRKIKAAVTAPTSLDGADGDVWLQYV